MNDKIKSWLFVSVQAILLLILIFIPYPETKPVSSVVFIGQFIESIGIIVLIFSLYDLRKSLSALPLPKKNGVLQVNGLYRYLRHPMYIGVLTLSLGIAISSGSALKFFIVISLYVLFSLKASYEEKLLIAKYPGYKSYMHKTRSFLLKI